MEWIAILFLLSMFIVLVLLLTRDYSDDALYVYTAAVPIGLPIIKTYEGTNLQSRDQDVVGVSFQINKNKDKYTYNYDSKYSMNITDVKVITDDGIVLIEMIPSNKRISGELYLSSTDRKYIRSGNSYLVCMVDGVEIQEPLKRIKILPSIK